MFMVLKVLVLLIGLAYAGMAAFLFFTQRSLVYFPTRDLESTPAEVGLRFEEVHFSNSFGTELHGWWLPRDDARFTLFFCHGNGGNISHRLKSFEIFHKLGLSVFIFDYSGYGLSQGVPSEKATRADALAAWDVLTGRFSVRPQDVVLFGRSLGGGVAAQLAADLKSRGVKPAGIIMESTFDSVVGMGRHMYPWLPISLFARYRYESDKHLAGQSIPALFIHGRSDDVVPWALGRKLYQGYGGPKRFLEIKGAHNSGYMDTGPAYVFGLDEYLDSLERERESGK